ncbi:putative PsbP family protein [Medicago truncatula]|uniref:Photosystem II reaction center PsbP family protein n=1 Tax=Medicago truncatula TaxID=3880 RepID=A0A072W2L8_MEDTR|nr:photosynthetic NDH subunit of lumenal location 1, chloroplastic [Medicago truncatula]KEH44485.1 photosystem II reaction center PsbP family protein [Medicago truncatula]RHN82707.1 putative PsbP family protein [Medicago truncatula]
MVVSSCSLTWTSSYLSHKLNLPHSNHLLRNTTTSSSNNVSCAMETTSSTERHCQRRPLLLGIGALTANLLPANSLLAEEIPDRYRSFVDYEDGYSYIYPSDWKEFDFRAHDSAFKDRYLQLQNVRVRFIPTEKKDIRDLGPMEEVITDLVKHRYTAPNQRPTIYDMQERTIDGKHYYTMEYVLTSRNYASASFTTLAIGNGRYYTLIVGANERRWKKVRDQLKVVADSFRLLDI